MKKLMLAILAVSTAMASKAQDIPVSSVPSVILNTFQQKFPNATDVEWELKQGQYEAEFDINRKDHKAYFDNTGTLLLHKQDIRFSELPAAVSNAIKKDFAAYKAEDAEKIESKGVTTYKVELEKKGDERKVTFSDSGKVIENIAD